MTLSEIRIKFTNEIGKIYTEQEKDQLFYRLAEDVLKFSRIDIALNKDQLISAKQIEQIQKIIDRLIRHEPIQYILGYEWFADLKIEVDKNVLIPRQETEELVDWIVRENEMPAPDIIDLCSGSGCIGLALKKSIPDSLVLGFDISSGAIKLSRQNSLNLELKVDFVEMDILNSDLGQHSADIIVSNPPYVRKSEAALMNPNVLEYEPHLALFVADEDPLIFYKRIAELSQEHLKEGGKLYLEINENLSDETIDILRFVGFHEVRIRKDLNDRFRMISCHK